MANVTLERTFSVIYCGEYYDTETGFIYLRARYYSPEIGRFVSEDTHWNIDNLIYGDREYKAGEVRIHDINAILQSGGLYLYCINKPLIYIDCYGTNTFAIGGELNAAFLLKLGISGQLVIDDIGG